MNPTRLNGRVALFALILAAAWPVAGNVAFAGAIRIWPSAIVSNDSVVVGDVAEIQGFDADATSRIASVVVFGSPAVGRQSLIRADDVRDALKEASINMADVRFFGASRCKVSRMRPPREPRATVRPATAEQLKAAKDEPDTPRELPVHKSIGPRKLNDRRGDNDRKSPERPEESNTVEQALRRHIIALFNRDEGRVEMRFSPTSEKSLAIGGPDLQFRIRNQDSRRTGLMSFEVQVTSPGAEPEVVVVSAEVTLVRNVVVARRAINQGQLITGRDLMLEERRFERNEDAALFDMAAAIGQQSRRFIREGELLDPRSIETRPLVRRGDLVKIVIAGGGVEIRTSGQAQSAGALGETITVRRDGSRRKQDLIDAVVAGPGLVTYGVAQRLVSRE